ncbi:uncharacterized protein PV07_02089 [Cladophialophora immunda]|uniref:Velvet domain-containing protein n=1 Tax=Cladophialophora immunda TaxID=569365 RepID=A0A0D2A4V8_9EURO|nr:uncharacterized protein PV07_02089 [Cladophialophora immunda]KIW35391.1 hypothetical protein PV07_02089 [Cladophialophora immunda]OQV01205.1 hypothetical protein CLAIMM_06599 [Cladophialophora immunda]
MTPTAHGSSSSTCVLSGSRHPPSFSLTTDAFASEAMYAHPTTQIPAPGSLDGQHRPSYFSAPAGQSQSPRHWPPSPFPPLHVAPHSRPVTGHGSENDSAFSPSSQPSGYSAPTHSPGTSTFSDRRRSYDPSPFQASFNELHEPMAQSRPMASSPVSDALPDAAAPSTVPATESPAIPDAVPNVDANHLPRIVNPARRCHLHIRQQPRAARAGPDGKDRRAVDPPPVVQLLMDDFDPDNEVDVAELRSPFWVVHCRLVGAVAVNSDVSTQSYYTDEGQKEVQRLLLGTSVASPTHTADDPDPPTMPTHPVTRRGASPPSSPTSRFLPSQPRRRLLPRAPQNIPGAFFIFADLSLRRAGEYRLQFTLMKMEPPLLKVGATVPAHHVVTSQVFRAVNAKDFDQVQPSTNLVRGLIDRGAGFPLKLKKGIREGQRRRKQWDEYSDEEDSGDYDNENE